MNAFERWSSIKQLKSYFSQFIESLYQLYLLDVLGVFPNWHVCRPRFAPRRWKFEQAFIMLKKQNFIHFIVWKASKIVGLFFQGIEASTNIVHHLKRLHLFSAKRTIIHWCQSLHKIFARLHNKLRTSNAIREANCILLRIPNRYTNYPLVSFDNVVFEFLYDTFIQNSSSDFLTPYLSLYYTTNLKS